MITDVMLICNVQDYGALRSRFCFSVAETPSLELLLCPGRFTPFHSGLLLLLGQHDD